MIYFLLRQYTFGVMIRCLLVLPKRGQVELAFELVLRVFIHQWSPDRMTLANIALGFKVVSWR